MSARWVTRALLSAAMWTGLLTVLFADQLHDAGLGGADRA